MTLHIYETHYRRGVIVKLARGMAHEAIIKFSIDKQPDGTYHVRRPGTFKGNRQIWQADKTGQTKEQAISYAIRECERIRDCRAGVMDAA